MVVETSAPPAMDKTAMLGLVFPASQNGPWSAYLQVQLVVFLFIIAMCLVGLRIVAIWRSYSRPRRACVVVMGDIGRSPRMTNHALSLADAGWEVDLVGYAESIPSQKVSSHKNITIRDISPPWKLIRKPKVLYILLAPCAAISRAVQLALAMSRGNRVGLVLVQNPPSIPTLAMARILTWFWSGAALVVDWHNFGYTIMQTTHAPRPAIAIAKLYEKMFGSSADGHLCVTKSMKAELEAKWGVRRANVLYDRPPASFRRTPEEERLALFLRLSEAGVLQIDDFYHKGTAELRRDRPALIVSSTSWTPDEDFNMLLDALKTLDEGLQKAAGEGKCVVVVTGKGPLKEAFEKSVAESCMQRVSVRTAWLRAEDYPVILGAADLGVCLHYSSSGLDLPMKVVDMFGCQLPVLAVSYACIGELVIDGQNGVLFDDAEGLSEKLLGLLQGFPREQRKIEAMRKELVTFQQRRWEDEWISCAKPLLDSMITASRSERLK